MLTLGGNMKFNILHVDESSRPGLEWMRNQLYDRVQCDNEQEMLKYKADLENREGDFAFEEIDYEDWEVTLTPDYGKDDVKMLLNYADSIVYILNEKVDVEEFRKNNGIKTAAEIDKKRKEIEKKLSS